MHSATQNYIDLKRENHRWHRWWEGSAKRVLDFVPPKYRDMLSDQINRSGSFASHAGKLPQGIIHGDLFCDNALFNSGSLAGLLTSITPVMDRYCLIWLSLSMIGVPMNRAVSTN